MSTDINLTSGIRTCLQSLQSIADLTSRTEERLATGLAVNSALDDPVAYFTAQDHTQRASDLQGSKDEMSEACQLIQTANSGIESMIDLLDTAKSLANSALAAKDSDESDSYMDEFNAIMEQIQDIQEDSYYKGTNLLGGDTEELTVTFDSSNDSSITLTGFDASIEGLGLDADTLTTNESGGWWDETDTENPVPNSDAIQTALDTIDEAKSTLSTESKTLSTKLATIDIRANFAENMINTLTEGAGNLINADLDEESANLLMLQTQQSLALNSLSMATQAAQGVLQLF